MAFSARRPNSGTVLDAIICNRPRLVSIASRIVHCPHMAEDVVQDAAVKVCQTSREQGLACPLHFVCSIVRNLAIDRTRRCALERRHAAPEAAADQVETHDDPEMRVVGCEALAIVLAALNELPDRTQLAFKLHRLDGVLQKNVAAALGVSPTLVNFMIRDAERHCRGRLQAYDAAEGLPTAAIRWREGGRSHGTMTHSRRGGGRLASAR